MGSARAWRSMFRCLAATSLILVGTLALSGSARAEKVARFNVVGKQKVRGGMDVRVRIRNRPGDRKAYRVDFFFGTKAFRGVRGANLPNKVGTVNAQGPTTATLHLPYSALGVVADGNTRGYIAAYWHGIRHRWGSTRTKASAKAGDLGVLK